MSALDEVHKGQVNETKALIEVAADYDHDDHDHDDHDHDDHDHNYDDHDDHDHDDHDHDDHAHKIEDLRDKIRQKIEAARQNKTLVDTKSSNDTQLSPGDKLFNELKAITDYNNFNSTLEKITKKATSSEAAIINAVKHIKKVISDHIDHIENLSNNDSKTSTEDVNTLTEHYITYTVIAFLFVVFMALMCHASDFSNFCKNENVAHVDHVLDTFRDPNAYNELVNENGQVNDAFNLSSSSSRSSEDIVSSFENINPNDSSVQ